jgi:uncharacterized LabA/DUF88 family protein
VQRHYSIAVLLDIENLIKGYAVSTNVIRTVPLKGIIEEVRRRLPDQHISVARAYANWSNVRLGVLREALNELGIQPVQVFGFGTYSTKNAADLQLAIDAVELALTRPILTTFVIVSGDGGFAALAGKLHEFGRTVVGASYEQAASPVFQAVCDDFVLIPMPEGLDGPRETAGESKEPDAAECEILPLPAIIPGLLEVPAYRNVTANGGLTLTSFHSYVTALLPDFQLPTYGFEKFLPFACAVCEGSELCVARDPSQLVHLIRRDRVPAGWQLVDGDRQPVVGLEAVPDEELLHDRREAVLRRWPVWPLPTATAALHVWLTTQPTLLMTADGWLREAAYALADRPGDELRSSLRWLQAAGLLQPVGEPPAWRLSQLGRDAARGPALLRSFLTARLHDLAPGHAESMLAQLSADTAAGAVDDPGSELTADLEAAYRELGCDPARNSGSFAALQRLPGQLREAATLAERVVQALERQIANSPALADWRQLNGVEYWQRLSQEPRDWLQLQASYLETAEFIVLLQFYGLAMRQYQGCAVPQRLLDLGHQLLLLTAESQSALRGSLERAVNGEEQRNPLQKAVFGWLKEYARDHRVHIQRFMKLSERADPALSTARLTAGRLLALEVYLRLRNELLSAQLLQRLATVITAFDGEDRAIWEQILDQAELLVLLGTATDDERLLNLIAVVREPLFNESELSPALEALRAALAERISG